jgi:hypothetical protein
MILSEKVKKNRDAAKAYELEKARKELEKARKNLPQEAALKGAALLEKQENQEKTNKPLREAEAKKTQADLAAKVKLKFEIEAANTKVKETHTALNYLYYGVIARKTGTWDAELKNKLQPLQEKIVNKQRTVTILEPQTPDELKETKESLQILLGKMQELKPQENFDDLTTLLNAIPNIETPKA